MKAEIGNAEGAEHFEGDIGLVPRGIHVVAEPGALERLATEGVGPGPDKIVPVADSETKMVGKPFSHHHFIGS